MRFFKKKFKELLIHLFKRFGKTNSIVIDWRDIGGLGAASALLNTMQAAHFLQPKVQTVPENKKVLVLAPHPDDEIIGMGGALLHMLQSGCEVKVLYFTSDGSDLERAEIVKVAQATGFSYEQFNFPMREIAFEKKNLGMLSQSLQTFHPDVIFLPFVLDDHPDHRDVSFCLLAVEDRLEVFKDVQIWAYQVYSSLPLNTVVNIRAAMDRKLDILRLYQSRFKPRDWAHYIRGLNAFNTRFSHQPTDKDYAEVFFRTKLKDYLALCRSYQSGLKKDEH